MQAKSPEEICQLFQRRMNEGDVEGAFALYDCEVVFLNEAAELRTRDELRIELARPVAAKVRFELRIEQVVRAGDIALVHTNWTLSAPQARSVYAIEVARRQRRAAGLAWRPRMNVRRAPNCFR